MNEFPVYVSDEATLELKRIVDHLENVFSSKQAKDNF